MSWLLDVVHSITLWRPRDAPPGTVVAVTTRLGGVSEPPYDRLNLGRSTADRPDAVAENRRRVLAALGLRPDRIATAGQVHGIRVTEAHEPGLHRDTDALVTRCEGLALAVSAADCLPLLLAAPGVVAAAHSGWRGTADGMPRVVLDSALALSGSLPPDVHVYLGPCIGPCCYRVGDEVAARFPSSSVVRRGDDAFVDLAADARRQLESSGVPPGSILDPPACTSCDRERCFSHRRDRGLTGRHWGIAALRR